MDGSVKFSINLSQPPLYSHPSGVSFLGARIFLGTGREEGSGFRFLMWVLDAVRKQIILALV